MYKFKWEPNLTVIEAKTNRKLAIFNSEGVFETTDEYVANKLIQKGIKYTFKAVNNKIQENTVKLLEETVEEKEKENLILKEEIEKYKVEIASLTENKSGTEEEPTEPSADNNDPELEPNKEPNSEEQK